MKVSQIYSLLNDINQQMWGEDAIKVNDLSGIISMGNKILDSSQDTDKFFGALVDRIGKTVVRNLNLEVEFPALLMNEFEFGSAIQKITIDPFGAIETSEWKVGDNNFTPTMLDVYKAGISVKIFQGATTWKFRTTIPSNTMLATAFTNASTMGDFISAIYSAMSDSMTMSINNMSRTAIVNFIAEKIKNNNGVVNVLKEYNALYVGEEIYDLNEAIHTERFLRFSANVIRNYLKYLGVPNQNYNVDGKVRVTTRDNMHAIFNSAYMSAMDSIMLSQTWHKELASIGTGYVETPYWQANKDAGGINDIDTITAIKVTPSSEEGALAPTDVEQDGVLGVLADRQAIFVGLNKRHNGAFYNSIDDYTNISASATIQWCNDLSENGIVFIAQDTNPNP